jgi:hypothetical protein
MPNRWGAPAPLTKLILIAHLLLRLSARHHHFARFEDECRPAEEMWHGGAQITARGQGLGYGLDALVGRRRLRGSRRAGLAWGRSQPCAHTKKACDKGLAARDLANYSEDIHRDTLARQLWHPSEAAAHVFGSRMRMMTAEKRYGQEEEERSEMGGCATGRARSHLWVILSVARVHGDCLQVELLDAQIAGGHNVPARTCNGVICWPS